MFYPSDILCFEPNRSRGREAAKPKLAAASGGHPTARSTTAPKPQHRNPRPQRLQWDPRAAGWGAGCCHPKPAPCGVAPWAGLAQAGPAGGGGRGQGKAMGPAAQPEATPSGARLLQAGGSGVRTLSPHCQSSPVWSVSAATVQGWVSPFSAWSVSALGRLLSPHVWSSCRHCGSRTRKL